MSPAIKKPSMAFLIVSAIVAFLTIIGVALYKYATDSPHRISSAEAKRRLSAKEIDVVLDVRTDTERKTLGIYPGSLHIQSADLPTEAPKQLPNKKARILAYCNTGHRARMATDKLHEMGYKNAVYISGQHTSLVDASGNKINL
jgi:rhodanese-related sulfurtransferase